MATTSTTAIGLTDTESAGAYTNADITVDAQWRIAAAADGTVGGFPARVSTDTSTPNLNTPIDGTAHKVQLLDGDNITGWTHTGARDDVNFEYTCSVDFLPPTSGSASVSPPSGAQLMSGASVFTIDSTGSPVTAILRGLPDGTVQLYLSETAA